MSGRVDGSDPTLFGGFLAGKQMTRPMFLCRIRRLDEEDFFALLISRHDHEYRVRLIDSGEVEKIAVLAVLVIDVVGVDPLGSAEQNQHRIVP